jgi:hypothetical protein
MDTPLPRITPLIPIDLDKRRYLRLDNKAKFRAEWELCQLWGERLNLFSVMSQDLMTLNDLSVLLWQGLLHEDPRLTLADVQAMMDLDSPDGLLTTIKAITEAWNASSPTPRPVAEEVEREADPLTTPSPGPPSGASPASISA